MNTMSQLGEFIATIQNNQDVRTAELEQRLAQLEGNEDGKGECVCGSYDEFLAAYEQRISDLEGNGGSTGPIPASQALEEYGFLFGKYSAFEDSMAIMSTVDLRHTDGGGYVGGLNPPNSSVPVKYLLSDNKEDIVKVYTPDLQEIEIIADSTLSYFTTFGDGGVHSLAVGNMVTKEVRCYQLDYDNYVVSPCTDEEFIAQWGNSDALGL